MSLETIQSEIAALRADVKSLVKLVRKVKSVQDDPTGEKAKARAANNGFNRKQEITPIEARRALKPHPSRVVL